MNRRTFTMASLASVLVGTGMRNAVAQSAPEFRWDETSRLYGNAWDVLGKAEDGKIQTLQSALGEADPIMNTGRLLALIHNNSEKPVVPASYKVGDENVAYGVNIQHEFLAPGGYALLSLPFKSYTEEMTEAPPLNISWVSENDARDMGWNEWTIPLTVNSVILDGRNAHLKLTNPSDEDASDSFPNGLIVWFDREGKITSAQDIAPMLKLDSNAEGEITTWVGDKYNPADLFLIGMSGFTS